MGGTEKKLLGGALLGLLALGTGGIGPLAFLGTAPAAAGTAGGITGALASGAAPTATAVGQTAAGLGAGGVGAAKAAGLGATLASMGKTAATGAMGSMLGAGAMQSMQPDLMTPLPMPQMQQPNLMDLFAMFGRNGGMS